MRKMRAALIVLCTCWMGLSVAEASLSVTITSPTNGSYISKPGNSKISVRGKYTCDSNGYYLILYDNDVQVASESAPKGTNQDYNLVESTSSMNLGDHVFRVKLWKRDCPTVSSGDRTVHLYQMT